MQKLEGLTSDEIFEGEAELEDITEELFDSIKELKGCQMLCNPDKLDLEETMSAFEVGCPKMDIRLYRDKCLTPQKA